MSPTRREGVPLRLALAVLGESVLRADGVLAGEEAHRLVLPIASAPTAVNVAASLRTTLS